MQVKLSLSILKSKENEWRSETDKAEWNDHHQRLQKLSLPFPSDVITIWMFYSTIDNHSSVNKYHIEFSSFAPLILFTYSKFTVQHSHAELLTSFSLSLLFVFYSLQTMHMKGFHRFYNILICIKILFMTR